MYAEHLGPLTTLKNVPMMRLCSFLLCASFCLRGSWENLIGNYNGRAESDEGEGGHFHFAACLPFVPQKFQEFLQNFKKLYEIVIAFEQIPAIPAEFRENFGEKKKAIWACSTQNLVTSWKIAEFKTINAKFAYI